MNVVQIANNYAAALHAYRVAWDRRYAALSAVQADIARSLRYSIGKSCEEEDAERAALAEVEAKIGALGPRP